MAYIVSQKLTKNSETDYGELDELGRRYVVPVLALKRARAFPILTGEKFIYYQPREDDSGRCYFGSGIISSVDGSSDDFCWLTFAAYAAFTDAVPYKIEGRYLETGTKKPPMFVCSIRRVGDEIANKIVQMGTKHSELTENQWSSHIL